MTKKELVANHKALKLEFRKLEFQFDDCCKGAWISAVQKDFVIPPKKTVWKYDNLRRQFYDKSNRFSERAWFEFGNKMNRFARAHKHPFDRWFDMIVVIDMDLKHHSVYQNKWRYTATKHQMRAHNKITGLIIKKLHAHVDLLIKDRAQWEKR